MNYPHFTLKSVKNILTYKLFKYYNLGLLYAFYNSSNLSSKSSVLYTFEKFHLYNNPKFLNSSLAFVCLMSKRCALSYPQLRVKYKI